MVTHGSVKIHPPSEDAKIRQQVPRERRLHSRDLRIETKVLGAPDSSQRIPSTGCISGMVSESQGCG